MSVKDSDHGYRDLVKRIYGLKKPRVAAGIFEADGGAPAGGGKTIIEIAVWNEFGNGTAPARSFIRAWFDENQDQIRGILFPLLRSVIAKRLTKEKALEQFGLWMQASIQRRIASGISPGNRPSTIAKKGSSTPLVDTGQLRTSVSFAVDLGEGSLRVAKTGGGSRGRDAKGRFRR